MINVTSLKIDDKVAIGSKVELWDSPSLLMVTEQTGLVMCGFLNMDTAGKLDVAAAMVSGVRNFDDVLGAEMHACIGIFQDFFSLETLRKWFDDAKKISEHNHFLVKENMLAEEPTSPDTIYENGFHSNIFSSPFKQESNVDTKKNSRIIGVRQSPIIPKILTVQKPKRACQKIVASFQHLHFWRFSKKSLHYQNMKSSKINACMHGFLIYFEFPSHFVAYIRSDGD